MFNLSGLNDYLAVAPSTNNTTLGFPQGVKALMRGFYPIHGLTLPGHEGGGDRTSSKNHMKKLHPFLGKGYEDLQRLNK